MAAAQRGRAKQIDNGHNFSSRCIPPAPKVTCVIGVENSIIQLISATVASTDGRFTICGTKGAKTNQTNKNDTAFGNGRHVYHTEGDRVIGVEIPLVQLIPATVAVTNGRTLYLYIYRAFCVDLKPLPLVGWKAKTTRGKHGIRFLSFV